jgi:conjugation system TraG family ATPase
MKKQPFTSPYVGIDTHLFPMLYTRQGHFSILFECSNPVTVCSTDPKEYLESHQLFSQLLSMLGAGHTLQKLDMVREQTYTPFPASDYLSSEYQKHFTGRRYKSISTYLVVTRQVSRGPLFSFDKAVLTSFEAMGKKVYDLIRSTFASVKVLSTDQMKCLIREVLSMRIASVGVDNLKVHPSYLQAGDRRIKSMPVIDVESMAVPGSISPYTTTSGTGMLQSPVGFLADSLLTDQWLYHQVIQIPDQRATLASLQRKKQRHLSIPDPANDLAVKDIDALLAQVADAGVLLVNAHFNVLLSGNADQVEAAESQLENELFKTGIVISKGSYNQMELFRSCLPGNSGELKAYDTFLTTHEAACCFLLAERPAASEPTTFPLFFTDRKGIPLVMDTNDFPLETGRIGNRNKFVLGPSGAGKSFFMNHLIRQYLGHGSEVVLVDTGHSYQGLCDYVGGTYITYSENSPITMNPFQISSEEFTEEKREFLKSLIGLLWKGAEGSLSQVEEALIARILQNYYSRYFKNPDRFTLSFDSFYLFSLPVIRQIAETEHLQVNVDEYAFVLRQFTTGERFGTLLNKPMSASLFDSQLIVFEIDAIKEHKILFPIITLIIMDVFLQKMRFKTSRKALIIEEAWKAIASPMMAGYILYLYKTVRKFRGEAVVVTQELDDILGNPIVKESILANSDTICLLDQTKFKDNYDHVAQLLGLNEVEQAKIFSMNQLDNRAGRAPFKEVYIKRGATGEVYGVEVSLPEYLTYTTERQEKEALQVYLQNHQHDMPAALQQFTRDLAASGKSLTAFCQAIHQKQHAL